MTWPGETEAWDILSGLDPERVADNAIARFDACKSTYALACLGQDILVSLPEREIHGISALGRLLTDEFSTYSRLSILKYLIHSTNLPLSGQLVRPSDLPGGDIFVRGTHVLPLNKMADRYGNDIDGFVTTGRRLGGTRCDYGDMSIRLLPFPRVPVVIIVWSGDQEFPPKSSLLLDSSCVSQIPVDIVWSTAMMAIEMMLADVGAHNDGTSDTLTPPPGRHNL